jgi:D-amino-acid dehydrogenase
MKGCGSNLGHGHQGFTQGPATAALVAEEMSDGTGPVPELSPANRTALGI